MDNIKKSFLIITLIIGIIAISIAFAAFSTNLSISGTASVSDTTWNIHFQNWALDTQEIVTEGGVTHTNTAEYPSVNELSQTVSVANSTKVENLNVTLKQPGDYVKYTFQIINEGSIDASLNNFTHNMTCESGKTCNHLTYTVECKDSQENNVLTEYSTLAKNGGLAYCTLQVKYNEQTNTGNTVYTQEATSATLSANWQYIQKVDNNSGEQGQSGSEETPIEPSNPNMFTYDDDYITGFNDEYFSETGEEYPTSIVIPLTYNGQAVTSIGSDAFYDKGLTSVIIPEGITVISNGAFESNELVSISIPSSVTYIGYNAFRNNNISSLTIDDNMCELMQHGEDIFFENSVVDITINMSNIPVDIIQALKTTGLYSGIRTITLGSNVTTIANNVFSYGYYDYYWDYSELSILNTTGRSFNWCNIFGINNNNCTFETGNFGIFNDACGDENNPECWSTITITN